ncbi:DinB family protein [Pedobacter sp. SYSU D00535]|uniref:DinB family protein n=1 Tax=Pedobacter sp. SYSU D00535 TaxID=2810308 RepID=UPI001A95F69E|nr:DinB family protein [Pedobacter sp. SYSU D00535]
MESNPITETAVVISEAQLLEHWQGHRALTRKMIEAFPEDKFYNYSVGGMRPFVELIMEMIDMADGGIDGIASREWKSIDDSSHITRNYPGSKQEVLAIWDRVTAKINATWPSIPEGRFQEVDKAFGVYENPVYATLFYFIDNEIHHRGQAYVYLRSLGITPPPFWERA